MNNYQYYVYVYEDSGGDVVYVGQGKGGRAWQCQKTNGDTQRRNDWKQEQLAGGRLPCDWVRIVRRDLSSEEARELEKRMIKDLRPVLNVDHNPDAWQKSYSLRDAEDWAKMRALGMSYKSIAEQTNVTTMTVWRALNNGTE